MKLTNRHRGRRGLVVDKKDRQKETERKRGRGKKRGRGGG